MKQQMYQKGIDACIECATSCNHCAVSSLENEDVQQLTKSIKLNLECAVICRATADLLSSGSIYSGPISQLCAVICNKNIEECLKHADLQIEHCNECIEACKACATETMAIYEAQMQKDEETPEYTLIQQDDCGTLSRAASELISLGSGYSQQISWLNAQSCNEYASQLEMQENLAKKFSKARAEMAIESHEHLKMHVQEAGKLISETVNGQPKKLKAPKKQKNNHSSALLAASMWRSPVGHGSHHTAGGLRGHYANMGTNFTYEEEDI